MEQYTVTGMSCAACSARVEKAVKAVPGVTSCSVSLLTNSMGVEGTASASAIVKAVQEAGYGASPKAAAAETPSAELDALADHETPRLKKRLIASLVFLAVLMYFSMGHMMWGWPLPHWFDGNHVAMGLVQLLLAGIVMVINQKFFISGFKGLLHRAPNMDTLVALGSSASFLWSTYALFAMTRAQVDGNDVLVMHYMMELYFESAAMILTLITVGKMLEARSKGKTTDALKGLMKLAPKTAVVVRDGQEATVPIEQVRKGDVFVVRPGENIPVDGVVLEGNSAVNEAALTGESIRVDKNPGDAVSAATVNQSGFIRCEATRVGEDTTLSQIIKMVSDAAATKAPIAKIADKISAIFVPIVITLAIIATIIWLFKGESLEFALSIGICVLVISCPCALGLATPTAIMVGTGKGASLGILSKSAQALETLHNINTVVLDKTGTITQGKPQVTDIYTSKEVTLQQLLTIASSLEKLSEHPLGEAILQVADKHNISTLAVENFKQIAGQGLSGIIDNSICLAGNQKLLIAHDIENEHLFSLGNKLAQQGKTPLYFTKDDKILGLIAIADTIKATSPQAIQELKNLGINIYMLTGDNQITAKQIAKQINLEENNIISDVLPQDKEAKIRQLQNQGQKVAMVGDGINDAPALARANVGIAIGAGTDIAIDSADIILMKNNLLDVVTAIKLSKAVIKNIRENLFWAFIYNIIGIPIAMGLFYTAFGLKLNPMIGALAMSFSSVFVVTNALRLRFFQNNYQTSSINKDNSSTAINIQAIDLNTSKGDDNMGLLNNLFHKNSEKQTEKIISIEGMMCQHCVRHATEALEKIDGVSDVKVSLEDKNAVIHVNQNVTDEQITNAIVEAGYEVTAIK